MGAHILYLDGPPGTAAQLVFPLDFT